MYIDLVDNKRLIEFRPESKSDTIFLSDFPGFLRPRGSGKFLLPVSLPILKNVVQRIKVRYKKPINASKEVYELMQQEVKLKEIPVDFEMYTKPYPHQELALRYMYTFGAGGLLLDPGLGKTKVILDYIALMKFKKSGIICPKSLLFVWEDEALVHRMDKKVYVLQSTSWAVKIDSARKRMIKWEVEMDGLQEGSDKWKRARQNYMSARRQVATLPEQMEEDIRRAQEADIVVFNYDKVANGMPFLQKHFDFDFLAIDEGLIKDPKTNRTKAITTLGSKVPYRCIMSGTLINNTPMDCYAPLRFLQPSLVSTSYSRFETYYGHMIKMKNSGRKFLAGVSKRNETEIKEILDACCIVMDKNEWLDLPEKQFIVHDAPLSEEQHRIQEELIANYIAEVTPDIQIEADGPLTVMSKLYQVANGFVYHYDKKQDDEDLYKLLAIGDQNGDAKTTMGADSAGSGWMEQFFGGSGSYDGSGTSPRSPRSSRDSSSLPIGANAERDIPSSRRGGGGESDSYGAPETSGASRTSRTVVGDNSSSNPHASSDSSDSSAWGSGSGFGQLDSDGQDSFNWEHHRTGSDGGRVLRGSKLGGAHHLDRNSSGCPTRLTGDREPISPPEGGEQSACDRRSGSTRRYPDSERDSLLHEGHDCIRRGDSGFPSSSSILSGEPSNSRPNPPRGGCEPSTCSDHWGADEPRGDRSLDPGDDPSGRVPRESGDQSGDYPESRSNRTSTRDNRDSGRRTSAGPGSRARAYTCSAAAERAEPYSDKLGRHSSDSLGSTSSPARSTHFFSGGGGKAAVLRRLVGEHPYGPARKSEYGRSNEGCDGSGLRRRCADNGRVIPDSRRCIIWYNLTAELEIILGVLEESGYGPDSRSVIRGGTKKIGDIVRDFNRDNSKRWLICQAQSVNYGITVLGTDPEKLESEDIEVLPNVDTNVYTHIFFSLGYSLERFLQQQDRSHRIGLKHSPEYHIILGDCVSEQAIYQALQDKINIRETFLVDIVHRLRTLT